MFRLLSMMLVAIIGSLLSGITFGQSDFSVVKNGDMAKGARIGALLGATPFVAYEIYDCLPFTPRCAQLDYVLGPFIFAAAGATVGALVANTQSEEQTRAQTAGKGLLIGATATASAGFLLGFAACRFKKCSPREEDDGYFLFPLAGGLWGGAIGLGVGLLL